MLGVLTGVDTGDIPEGEGGNGGGWYRTQQNYCIHCALL